MLEGNLKPQTLGAPFGKIQTLLLDSSWAEDICTQLNLTETVTLNVLKESPIRQIMSSNDIAESNSTASGDRLQPDLVRAQLP